MEQIKKGSKVPRVKALCIQCGCTFERSAVHPYIVKCQSCRGITVVAKIEVLPLAEAEAAVAAACHALKIAADASDDIWLSARDKLFEAVKTRDAARANKGIDSMAHSVL